MLFLLNVSTVELTHDDRRIVKLKENVLCRFESFYLPHRELVSFKRIIRDLVGISCFKRWLAHKSC